MRFDKTVANLYNLNLWHQITFFHIPSHNIRIYRTENLDYGYGVTYKM